MAYTDIDKPSDYFNTVLYTGTENSNTISVGFEPNFTWIKRRNSARDHQLFNSITGANTVLSSNLTSAEEGTGAGGWTPNSDGFVVHQHVKTNSNGDTYVGWNWKAGTSFTNDASATGIGTIDSAGSANDTVGFSIVTYTAAGAVATIKHGLSSAPKMIFTKKRNGSPNWGVYYGDATDYLELNTTAATQDDVNMWNDTAPTSSVFSVGGDNKSSGSGNYVAYCFAEKQGYSKFGSYTGNGNANGTFVYLGFKPAFVMMKLSSAANENWAMYDNKRDTFNSETTQQLRANTSADESTSNSEVNLLSNGFKVNDSNAEINGSGETFIFMAFAENPLVTSTGVPATAR